MADESPPAIDAKISRLELLFEVATFMGLPKSLKLQFISRARYCLSMGSMPKCSLSSFGKAKVMSPELALT